MMPKFTFICEHLDPLVRTTHEFEVEYIGDVVQEFETFLRGSGFYFDGNLDFVEEQVTNEGYDINDYQGDTTEAAQMGWPFPSTRPGGEPVVTGPIDESGIGNIN